MRANQPAARRHAALSARSRCVERVDVNVGIVNDLDRVLAARCGSTGARVVAERFGGKRNRPLVHLGVLADSQKGDAELVRRLGGNIHRLDYAGDNGQLVFNDALTKLGVELLSGIVSAQEFSHCQSSRVWVRGIRPHRARFAKLFAKFEKGVGPPAGDSLQHTQDVLRKNYLLAANLRSST